MIGSMHVLAVAHCEEHEIPDSEGHRNPPATHIVRDGTCKLHVRIASNPLNIRYVFRLHGLPDLPCKCQIQDSVPYLVRHGSI